MRVLDVFAPDVTQWERPDTYRSSGASLYDGQSGEKTDKDGDSEYTSEVMTRSSWSGAGGEEPRLDSQDLRSQKQTQAVGMEDGITEVLLTEEER